jgi:hypothetical protein
VLLHASLATPIVAKVAIIFWVPEDTIFGHVGHVFHCLAFLFVGISNYTVSIGSSQAKTTFFLNFFCVLGHTLEGFPTDTVMFRTKGRTPTGNLTRGFLTAPAALNPTGTDILVGYGDTGNAFTCAMVNGHAI